MQLSDRPVGERGAAFAAECLRKIPLRPSCCSSASSCSYSHLQPSPAAVQQRISARGAARRRAPLQAQFTPRSGRRAARRADAGSQGATPAASARRERLRSEAALQDSAISRVMVKRWRSTFTDVSFIIPTFILTRLPVGLVGLLIRHHPGRHRHDRRRTIPSTAR